MRADHRRRGHASEMMEALERVIRDAYEVGALGATDEAKLFYAGRGWRLWGGPLSALTPDGVVRTPDEQGGVYVLPVEGVPLDLSGGSPATGATATSGEAVGRARSLRSRSASCSRSSALSASSSRRSLARWASVTPSISLRPWA